MSYRRSRGIELVYLLSLLVVGVGIWLRQMCQEKSADRSLGLVKIIDSVGKCQSDVNRADGPIL